MYYSPITEIPTTGIVARHYPIHNTDDNGITTIQHQIESTNGVHYPMNQCFEVTRFDQNTAWYNYNFKKKSALQAAQSKLYI